MCKKTGQKERRPKFSSASTGKLAGINYTKAFKAFPGLNFGTFFAGMVIFLPVAGLMPILLFLFITENVPKPVRTTGLPPLRATPTEVIKASKHSLQVDLGNLVTFAMCSTTLALFIKLPFMDVCL